MNNKNILITDDSTDVRETVKMALSKNFSNIYEASTGAEAIEILKKVQIDLVILDYALPKENGMEVLKKIAANPLHKPAIIVYSGYCSIMSDEKVALDTVMYFIEKPYSPEKMLPIIYQALGE